MPSGNFDPSLVPETEKQGIVIYVKINPKVEPLLKKAVSEALIESAGIVARDASRRAPVRTGTLRHSIDIATDDTEASIGTNVDYAYWVEYAIGKQARLTGEIPFLRPALYNNREAIAEAFFRAFHRINVEMGY